MKKLIPALCMLLVAACLMGTSTYAWFAANEEVTASGMSIKAASDGGLAIASYNGTKGAENPTAPAETEFKNTAVLNVAEGDWMNGAETIKPTSWNGTNWFNGEADDSDNFAASSMAQIADTMAARAGYMNHTRWAMKTLKDGATCTVKVTGIEVTAADGSSVNLDKSIRVAVKSQEGKWYVFAPKHDNASGLNYVASFTASPFAVTTGTDNIIAGTTPNATVFDTLGTTAQWIDVYVYYEGQDEFCATAYATNINTLSVKLTYIATENLVGG